MEAADISKEKLYCRLQSAVAVSFNFFKIWLNLLGLRTSVAAAFLNLFVFVVVGGWVGMNIATT